ncbi:MAG: HAD-IIIC family phosphatase [Kineosporiaceae bacterium]
MTLEAVVPAPAAEPVVTRPPAPLSPLRELRALRREGLDAASAARVAHLASALTDPLDVEAAGRLLAADDTRAQLTAAGWREQRVALVGSSTLDQLPPLLTAACAAQGITTTVAVPDGFDQWRLQILAGAPAFADLDPRLLVCLLDDEAVFGAVADPLDLDAVEERLAAFPAELEQWVAAAHRALPALVVLTTIPLSPLRRDRLVDHRSKARLDAAWLAMNAGIAALAARHDTVVVLSADLLAERAGGFAPAPRMRHAAAHAYSPAYLHQLALELARLARADLGMARKVLVLDLDHTLWGGVVGDDGVAGVTIGGGWPGSGHAELQRLAKDLSRQGVLLAVASKNDDAVAREAIATHPDMVLAPEDFVAVRANWEPKPGNVTDLAAGLNLGVDACVFVDDNPAERDLMTRLLPQVATVDLPADPAAYAAAVAARGDFTVVRLTGEDRERTAMYRSQAARADAASSAGSLTEYLTDLRSVLTLEAMTPLNAARIVQLFGKTNQFNLTGRRYGAEEVEHLRAAGTTAFVGARLADRFGDNGLISAVAIGERHEGDALVWDVENVVLSCRVFGRDVEHAIVGLVLRAACAAGVTAVTATFRPTAKNRRFGAFYPSLGFRDVGDGERADAPEGARQFRHDLDDLADLPPWVSITPTITCDISPQLRLTGAGRGGEHHV